MKAQSVIDVMLGEAVHGTRAQRWADMVAIASVIENRARRLGVTPEEVVASTQEFNAFNKALPAGVEKYRSLAQQALDYVKQNGPVHNASFYAAPDAVDNLPPGLQEVMRTTGHVYKSDPKNRAIMTAKGYKTPGRTVSLPSSPPTPTRSPGGLGFTPSIAGMGGLGAQASGTAQFAEAVNPARWGARPAGPASGLFGATTGIDPNKPFDFAGMDMGRMLAKNVAISPNVAARAAGLKTSPQNWDVGPTSPFDFSKIDMGRMLSNTMTPTGTGWTAAPATPEQRAARTAAAAAKNATLDSPFEAMRIGLDNQAFAAIQGNELQIGKSVPAAPPTQVAAAPATPTVNATLAGGLSPGWGTQASIDFNPTTDETLTAYGPEEVAPPSRFEKFRTAARPAVRNALLGMKVAGLPGAAIGALAGMVPDSWRPDFGPTFDAAVPAAERFSTGYGLGGITAAMGGPRGAQGFSRSNPGMSYTSLGNGQGVRRSEKYGWSEVVGPDGSVRGISYDSPTGGGLLGDISRAMNERFGGKSKAEAAKDKADRSKFSGRSSGGRAGTGSHGRGGGRLT